MELAQKQLVNMVVEEEEEAAMVVVGVHKMQGHLVLQIQVVEVVLNLLQVMEMEDPAGQEL